jgi:hypothetical protein
MLSEQHKTPLIPCPQSGAPQVPPHRHVTLRAPIVVVAAGKEWELAGGILTIGRDPEANISIEDTLVSWLHARIGVQSDSLVILEDLHSTNGVFVNGTKMSRPQTTLCEGDRLLLGTTEISVFGLRASHTVRVDPNAQVLPEFPVSATLRSPSSETSLPVARMPRRRATVTTGRSSAIDLVGQFAEQMMDSGHPLEAVRTLSEPLQNLLKGASAGLSVPLPILESSARYALRLREWTERDAWLEYIFELHLACQQVPSECVLQLVEEACSKGAKVDRSLVRYLVATLERRPSTANLDEQAALARLKRLAD